jgi:hypothetical protein
MPTRAHAPRTGRKLAATQWPDGLRLSDIEHRFVCEVCGKRGAEVLWFSPAGLIWRNDFPCKAA